jgi:hypothetical protein
MFNVFRLIMPWGEPIDIILNDRLLDDTYCLHCFVLLVLLVAAAKIYFEEVPTRQAGLQSRQV